MHLRVIAHMQSGRCALSKHPIARVYMYMQLLLISVCDALTAPRAHSQPCAGLALAGHALPAQNGASHGFVFKHLHANLANHKILKIHLSHVQEVLAALGTVREQTHGAHGSHVRGVGAKRASTATFGRTRSIAHATAPPFAPPPLTWAPVPSMLLQTTSNEPK